ncbi:hypothetical protein STEG23_004594, partial [Scotinomys teguina]
VRRDSCLGDAVGDTLRDSRSSASFTLIPARGELVVPGFQPQSASSPLAQGTQ